MKKITREQTKTMIESDVNVSLIEVLDEKQFAKFHLPGADNVPLANDFTDRIQEAVPDKSQPVILYCYDDNCPASAKAATHMEQLGYTRIYDYAAGKIDWKNAHFPVEVGT